MFEQLLPFYETELHALHTQATEFGKRFPELADSLGIQGQHLKDPLLRHLLQAFAFFSARLHYQLDQGQGALLQSLLRSIAPQHDYPYPSLSIAQFSPRSSADKNSEIPEGSLLYLKANHQAPCEFKVCYPTKLIPLQILELDYQIQPEGSALKLKLRASKKVFVESIGFYINLPLTQALSLYGLLHGAIKSIELKHFEAQQGIILKENALEWLGFKHPVLPYPKHVLEIHRIMAEFFAYPQKFMFFELTIPDEFSLEGSIEIQFNFSECDSGLKCTKQSLLLNCSPIINIFTHHAEPILTQAQKSQYPLILEQNPQTPLYLYAITQVYGKSLGAIKEYFPLLHTSFKNKQHSEKGYWDLENTRDEEGKQHLILKLMNNAAETEVISCQTLCCQADYPRELFQQHQPQLYFKKESHPGIEAIHCILEPTSLKTPPKVSPLEFVQYLNTNYCLGSVSEGLEHLKKCFSLYNRHQLPALAQLLDSLIELSQGKAWTRLNDGLSCHPFLQQEIQFLVSDSSLLKFQLFKEILEKLFESYSNLNTPIKVDFFSKIKSHGN